MLKINNKTALIIIDLQHDYFHSNGQMGCRGHGTNHLHKMIPKIDQFLSQIRKHEIPVIWTQMIESIDGINPILGGKRKLESGQLNEREMCIPGTKGFNLMIKPNKQDNIFHKNDEDIFSNPKIDQFLKTNLIQNLIIIGGYTHKCILNSILTAIKLGYNPIIIEDLVNSPKINRIEHTKVLKQLKNNNNITLIKSKFLDIQLQNMQNKDLYNDYFDSKKDKLLATLKAFNKTKIGTIKKLVLKNLKTYNDFLKIPILSPKKISQSPYSYVVGNTDKFVIKRTSGTTGKPRIIFHDPKTRTATYPPRFKDFLFSHKDDLLIFHRKADVTSNFMIDRALKKISKDMLIGEFSTPEEGIQILLENKDRKFVYIPELTTVRRRFAHYLEQAIKDGIISKKDLKKDFVNIEFTGEYMSLEELKEISDQAEAIFGIKPELTVCYGMTEQSGIGVYLYDEKDTEMWYKVKDTKFVEILKDKKTVIEEDGEILVTQLDWNTGTILPRYNTEDIGKLKFKDGIPYIVVHPRERIKGWFTITTNNYNAAEIVKDIETKFNIVFQAEFQVYETQDLKEILNIKISSSSFNDKKLVAKVEDRIVDIIFEQLSKASQQFVKVRFEVSTDIVMNKRWSVKKKQKSDLNFNEF